MVGCGGASDPLGEGVWDGGQDGTDALRLVVTVFENHLRVAFGHELLNGSIRVMTHITVHYAPAHPCAEPPGGLLADLGGEGTVVEVGSEHGGLGLEEVALVHHPIPDGTFVGLAPVPLLARVADDLVGRLIGQQLAEQPHLFAAVDDVLQQAVVAACVGDVLRDEHAQDICRNALGAHGLLLVFIDHLVVVRIVAAEVHIHAHTDEVVVVEDRRVEARYEQNDRGHRQGGVEVVHARKALIQFGLHTADVGELLAHALVGLKETHCGVGEELRQLLAQVGGVAAFDPQDSLHEEGHKLVVVSVQPLHILPNAVGADAEQCAVEPHHLHLDGGDMLRKIVLSSVASRQYRQEDAEEQKGGVVTSFHL